MRINIARLSLLLPLLLLGCTGHFGTKDETPKSSLLYPDLPYTETALVAGVAYQTAGSAGYADGSPGKFKLPGGIALDSNYYYVADSGNHTIRRISRTTGVAQTIAGINGSAGSADGAIGISTFNQPIGLLLVGSLLYVADFDNYTIRTIDVSSASFTVSTVAGSAGNAGDADGAGTSARFVNPTGMVLVNGSLYIADQQNHTVRKMRLSDYDVSTVAGSAGNVGDSDGDITTARFNLPSSLIHAELPVEGDVIFIADLGNNLIRKLKLSDLSVTTIAGDITSSGFVDNANGLSARFDQPANLTSDGRSLYVADVANKAIRKVSLTDYSVTTLLSSPSSTIDVFGALAATRFGMVSALYFDTQLGLIGTTESAIYRVK